MLFKQTQLKGAFIIEPELRQDERGFFTRTFCKKEFINYRIEFDVVQCNLSYNKRKGTLRGLHYQSAPFQETKQVMCTQGAIYDVIIDIRPGSPTYKEWIAVELTAENHRILHIPKGFAHGFQTLVDNTIVYYLMSDFYHQENSCGIRADDPALNIQWPLSKKIQSKNDRSLPSIDKQVGLVF
jgi:dTDP-4-dehydrorhamnose 3,5-epimerase